MHSVLEFETANNFPHNIDLASVPYSPVNQTRHNGTSEEQRPKRRRNHRSAEEEEAAARELRGQRNHLRSCIPPRRRLLLLSLRSPFRSLHRRVFPRPRLRQRGRR